MTSSTLTQISTTLIGLAAVVGATVAVCLGHIDTSTYVAIVGPLAGIGVGAGVHAAGTNTGLQTANGAKTTAP